MSELSIKLTIAGRTYPLTIKREEEEMIRKAAKSIDDQVNKFGANYAVKDKQDLLAMTALQLATRNLSLPDESDNSQLDSDLTEIDQLLNEHLG